MRLLKNRTTRTTNTLKPGQVQIIEIEGEKRGRMRNVVLTDIEISETEGRLVKVPLNLNLDAHVRAQMTPFVKFVEDRGASLSILFSFFIAFIIGIKTYDSWKHNPAASIRYNYDFDPFLFGLAVFVSWALTIIAGAWVYISVVLVLKWMHRLRGRAEFEVTHPGL